MRVLATTSPHQHLVISYPQGCVLMHCSLRLCAQTKIWHGKNKHREKKSKILWEIHGSATLCTIICVLAYSSLIILYLYMYIYIYIYIYIYAEKERYSCTHWWCNNHKSRNLWGRWRVECCIKMKHTATHCNTLQQHTCRVARAEDLARRAVETFEFAIVFILHTFSQRVQRRRLNACVCACVWERESEWVCA